SPQHKTVSPLLAKRDAAALSCSCYGSRARLSSRTLSGFMLALQVFSAARPPQPICSKHSLNVSEKILCLYFRTGINSEGAASHDPEAIRLSAPLRREQRAGSIAAIQ